MTPSTHPAPPVASHEPTEALVDDLLLAIDQLARDYDHYEYGLPLHDAVLADMREAVRAFARRAAPVVAPAEPPKAFLIELAQKVHGVDLRESCGEFYCASPATADEYRAEGWAVTPLFAAPVEQPKCAADSGSRQELVDQMNRLADSIDPSQLYVSAEHRAAAAACMREAARALARHHLASAGKPIE